MLTTLLWLGGFLVLSFGFVAFFGAPYVPTHRRQVNKAFDDLYKLGKDDVLVDIGSGDGVLLRAASARGARAIGYELNPILVAITRFLSRKDPRVKVYCKNFWRQTLPENVTVAYAFLESRDIGKMERYLYRQVKERQKPLHFISYGFALPTAHIEEQVGALYLYKISPRTKV